MILIQGAMDIEIEYLKNSMKQIEKRVIDGYEFFVGELEEISVVVSKTEVGVINATIATTLGIKEFNPDIIINQGTAGRIWRNNS